MNDLLAAWGLSGWKHGVDLLALSPLPLLVLVLVGGWMLRRRVRGGLAVLVLGVGALWAASTPLVGDALIGWLTRPPPALDEAAIERLRGAPRTAIVVLGGGRRWYAPEYGRADLKPRTLERLRYGLWLARRTGLPVAFSGGLGPGSVPGPTEAAIARVVAGRDFGLPLRWVEDRSHDTAENGAYSVALLHAAGVERIVLVTHAAHERRALAAFERAAARQQVAMAWIPAPVAVRASRELELRDLLPSPEGMALTYYALHEWVGRLAGA